MREATGAVVPVAAAAWAHRWSRGYRRRGYPMSRAVNVSDVASTPQMRPALSGLRTW
jgi:hypothetical protein